MPQRRPCENKNDVWDTEPLSQLARSVVAPTDTIVRRATVTVISGRARSRQARLGH